MQSANDVLHEASQCHLAGDFGRAEYLYCKLIAHAETHPVAHFLLGTLYAQTHAHGRALVLLKRAIELQPEGNGAMENLAAVYRELEDLERARYWGGRAIELARTPISLSNMAGTYINDGNPEPALKWADEALSLEPDMAQAWNHKALALLEMGRFDEGWAIYDHRLDLPQMHRRPFTCPMWDGRPVKRLAIHGEQGLGDEILFLTCLAQLRDRCEEVEIEVNHRLVRLMQNSFPDAQIYAEHDDRPFEPDAYIPMGSLPRLCWPVKPNTYLKPTTRYPRTPKRRRIGLSWRGGTMATHSKLRNAPLDDWKPLLEQGECVSLQYGDFADEAEALGISHDAEAIADLDRLAAMIRSCDFVVTVCNTTVHLAGALGVPCVVLVPSKPAWRYGLTGEKMVWYDSPVMVRQQAGESWASVIQRAKAKCADYRIVPRAQQAAA